VLDVSVVHGALHDLLRTRPVYVVCSDTRVETPAIVEHVHRSIAEMQSAARALSLPVSCHIAQPPLSDTFWVRIIGHGYPPPSRLFRWCTDRMKIKPNNSFVREHIHPDGEVLLLMGARVSWSIAVCPARDPKLANQRSKTLL
jgi:DNA sulfur modification protein DndC